MQDFLKFGVVVPSLGNRIDYLGECVKSIRNSGCENIFIVSPKNIELESIFKDVQEVKILGDPGLGLSGAINFGIANMPKGIEYVTWLGDDDLFEKNTLFHSLNAFKNNPSAVAVYGKCRYIGPSGEYLFVNRSGQWATTLRHFLPNLIPQPGSFVKRIAFEKIGGVSPTYPLAFDFEMFFNLRRIGELKYVPQVLGNFRWHSQSMTVDQRSKAVIQTSQIRKSNLNPWLRKFSNIWEVPIRSLTLLASKLIPKKRDSD